MFSPNQKQNFLGLHLLSWKEETSAASCLQQVRKPRLAEPELALSHFQKLIRILGLWDSKL